MAQWDGGQLVSARLPRPAVRAAGTVTPAPTVAPAWTNQPFGTRWGKGAEALEAFIYPPALEIWDRAGAMSVPTISRARDLVCSTVAALPILHYRIDLTVPDPEPTPLAPLGWMMRPDPNRTRQWLLAWTTDDLFFSGVAYWEITGRYVDGYPSAFTRLDPTLVSVDRDGTIRVSGRPVPTADVVQFLSPIEGLLVNGYRAIATALELERAALRFAGCEIPAGVLRQTGGEELSPAEWGEQIAAFETNRRAHTIAGLNASFTFEESTMDPSRLQLVEARDHQALELARLANVPPYLVGAPTGTGMTYQNAEQARGDLIDFGSLPFIGCIEQTLSGPNVLPLARGVRLGTEAWLRSPFTAPAEPATEPEGTP